MPYATVSKAELLFIQATRSASRRGIELFAMQIFFLCLTKTKSNIPHKPSKRVASILVLIE